MESHEYRAMFDLERSHWWFQSRLAMIERLLERHVWPAVGPGPRLIDLGCGTGMFLQRRMRHCRAVGSDFSRQALSFSRKNGCGPLCQADASRLPFADGSADLITAFDLIEHVREDQRLVREAWRVLRPGGYLMASVPAHPLLWSRHDVSLHHMRRYRRGQFEELFAQPGRPERWQTVRMTGAFCLAFPVTSLMRLSRRFNAKDGTPRSDTQPAPPWINRSLIALHRLEATWLTHFDLPIGVSLMTIRKKSD